MSTDREVALANKEALSEIQELIRQGEYTTALRCCEKLPDEARKTKLAMLLEGTALWELADLDVAEQLLRRATELHPKTEILSLLYFQVLFEQNKKSGAQGELRRFLLLRDSKVYEDIIDDYGWSKTELLQERDQY